MNFRKFLFQPICCSVINGITACLEGRDLAFKIFLHLEFLKSIRIIYYKNISSPLSLTAVVTVDCNSNMVQGYLTEQTIHAVQVEEFQLLWFCEVLLRCLSIIAEIAEKLALPNSSPTSTHHRHCF